MAEHSYNRDTIVAAATPAGTGGVAIVRLSGDDAEAIASGIMGDLPEPRRAQIRLFSGSDNERIDYGMALYFPGPNSFTGESVVEFHAHGGPVVVGLLIDAAMAQGARRAEPGEFSKRAFLNGKLDLSQAEAIADLIGSGTRQAAAAALRSLTGAFSEVVHELVLQVRELRTYVEAAIDFPDEDIDFLSDLALARRIDLCREKFDEVTAAAENGRVLRDGLQVVIMGPPNAGKSSLLNALAGSEAAIVTDIAGTTRDVLREHINIDGLAVELIDTAGLREDPGVIEAEGIRRARSAMESADAILWLADVTASASEPPEVSDERPVLRVFNKVDLGGQPTGRREEGIFLSALTGAGLGELREALKSLAGFTSGTEGTVTARQRHVDALLRARQHFDTGARALSEQVAGEIFAEELRLSLDELGTITGHISSDDLLGDIFSSFCIGK